MNDIYDTPSADLIEAASNSEFGSVERGIAGDYTLTFRDTFREAWAQTKGAKGQIWLAFLLYFGITIAVQFLGGMVLTSLLGNTGTILTQIIVTIISMPLYTAITLLGVKRMAKAPIRATSIFNYYGKTIKLVLAIILMYILMLIGFILFVLPGIYLMISYMFALILIIEKDMNVWQAMETSRKTVTHQWFKVFGIFILLILIMAISFIPLGIGIIWALPFLILSIGSMYLTMFGIEQTTLTEP